MDVMKGIAGMLESGQDTNGCAPKAVSRRDGLKLGAGAVMALVMSPAVAQQRAGNAAAVEKPLFELLPNWSLASADKPMTVTDLVNLKDAAVRFLKRVENGELPALEAELGEFAIRNYQPGSTFNAGDASGFFLLLRIVFEVPDITGANEAWDFGGWHPAEDILALKEKREADDFHPGWPVYLARISNKLYVRSNAAAKSSGSRSDYRALDEYSYMRSKYRFRTAESISKMEFIFVVGK